MSQLRMNLLGPFEACLDGQSIGKMRIKARALLITLAVEGDRPQRREALYTLLWPGMPEKSARHNLNQAVYTLRKITTSQDGDPSDPIPLILSDRQTLQLNPAAGVKVDVHLFDDLLASTEVHAHPDLPGCPTCEQALRQALDLYRGDFLSDFYLEDSSEFEAWAEAVRERYHRKQIDLLATLGDIRLQSGDYEQAIGYIERQLAVDPLHEPAQRQKIKTLALAGRRVEAMRHYRAFASELDEQLGVTPSQETIDLYERLRSEDLATEPRQPAAPTPKAADLPTGTVTFLFTDIQGSTPLWESEPDQMAAALEVHNTALSGAIESHGGAVFKTVGDAFQAAFATAPQALNAAIDSQQALKGADWNVLGELKVRMGLHTGEAALDPGGDEYAVSHTKNRAARIMSAAYGGQVLLSQETKELVDHQLPEGVSLKDLGEHRLKGLDLPEHIYQASAPRLEESFPPLRSETKIRHNLPPARTSFIGREAQIAEVQALLDQHPFVTLTGPGGVGKTRLAIQVAGKVLADYPNGVWLVELAGISEPALVPKSVAAALNLPEIPGKSVSEALVDFLRRKRLLLVLDNCEHLLEACSELADQLLSACPDLTILASSREFLGVRGEMPYRVPPLARPDPHDNLTVEQLGEYDAVRLFVARGRVAATDFSVTENNAGAIIQVVRRLDGIPLAIELAAARLRLLSVTQIAQRLDDAFRLLTGGDRGALPRHQTLRASIDWSYNLLSGPEQTLLRRLSVFAGGWRLGAAEHACSGGEIREQEVLDLLSGLVDKSFVNPISTAGSRNRFQMLETVRQYAHEKLVGSSEASEVRDRHLAYYLDWVEETAPKIRGPEQIRTLEQFEHELDNLRLALAWGLRQDIAAELKISTAMMWFWHIRSHEHEGIEWLSRGLETAGDSPANLSAARSKTAIDPLVRARAMVTLGFFRWLQFYNPSETDYAPWEAINLLKAAIAIYQAAGAERDPTVRVDLAWAQLWQAHYIGTAEGDLDRVGELVQEPLAVFRASDNSLGIAECLQLLGFNSRDPAEASIVFQEQLAIQESRQDPHGMGNALWFSAIAAVRNGEYETARQAVAASLVHYQQIKDLAKTVDGLGFLGVCYQYCGDLGSADEYNRQSLVSAYDLGIESSIVNYLYLKSLLRMAQGRYQQAAEANQAAWGIAKRTGAPPVLAQVLELRIRLACLQGDTAQAQLHIETLSNLSDLRSEQKSLVIPFEKGQLALWLGDLAVAGAHFRAIVHLLGELNWENATIFDGLALLALKKGEMGVAARLFGSRWCRGYAHFLSPIEKEWRQPDWEAMQAALGEERFERLYEAGRALTFAEAVDLVEEIVGE